MTISSISYEAWRISYQSSEQAARAAFNHSIDLAVENQELKLQLEQERHAHKNTLQAQLLQDAIANNQTGSK